MLRTYGVPWINKETPEFSGYALEFLGYAFFPTPREARQYVEKFYAAIGYVDPSEFNFGPHGRPRHGGHGGFMLEWLEVPEDSLIALSTIHVRHGNKMLREGTSAVAFNHDPADVWYQIRNLRVIGKPREIPYISKRPTFIPNADLVTAAQFATARVAKSLRPARSKVPQMPVPAQTQPTHG
jgi:hypothetical protein